MKYSISFERVCFLIFPYFKHSQSLLGFSSSFLLVWSNIIWLIGLCLRIFLNSNTQAQDLFITSNIAGLILEWSRYFWDVQTMALDASKNSLAYQKVLPYHISMSSLSFWHVIYFSCWCIPLSSMICYYATLHANRA